MKLEEFSHLPSVVLFEEHNPYERAEIVTYSPLGHSVGLLSRLFKKPSTHEVYPVGMNGDFLYLFDSSLKLGEYNLRMVNVKDIKEYRPLEVLGQEDPSN